MGDNKSESVFTSFGKDRFYRVCDIVLEFIDIEKKIFSVFFCHTLPAKGCNLDL